jgi:serine/threonine protein kinase
MPQRPGVPKSTVDSHASGALSGDMKVDDGDGVYVAGGDLVAGKYCIECILGVGAVGFVVAARHTDLGGHFALKFLKKRFLDDKTIVERFTREAKAACRIKSEYVARVYDVGTHGPAPFIVMEHLGGRDLRAVLAERGAFPVSEAVEYAVQACAALAVAHASGIVHRDIKPENLFVVDEDGLPTIKLLDFGISKIALAADRPADEWGAEGEPITGTLVCGTPFYMSPEQIRSTATVDARSDVWSLGMVLYEMLTATTAFRAETVMDVCTAILDQAPRSLADVRPEVPVALAAVVARCLQKSPESRFATVAELAVALLPFAPPRALAIAEGSPWIRRAAIQTLGSLAPVGASSGVARPTPAPAQVSLPSPPVRSSSRLQVGLVTGVALVVGSMAVWSGARLLRSNDGDATAKRLARGAAGIATESIVAKSSPPSAGLSDERSAPPAHSHPLPVASPASAPVAPARPLAPSRPRVVTPPRMQPSAKAALSTESSSAPPAIGPPVAPGRPDLGY